MEIKLTGHIKAYNLYKCFDKARKNHLAYTKKTLEDFSEKGVNDMRKRMEERKSGSLASFQGRSFNRSAPGESPAVESGNLWLSTEYKLKHSSSRSLLHLGYTAFYGKFLEFGTASIKPRPNIYHVYRDRKSMIHPIMNNLERAFFK